MYLEINISDLKLFIITINNLVTVIAKMIDEFVPNLDIYNFYIS